MKAEHPGSCSIQEFVRELEVLWDELIRKHQRNALVLQVSEELNHKVHLSSDTWSKRCWTLGPH